ncbi:MAG: helix-turn-helix domain-containing protein [Flavobacteriia bacterium]|nr:helix-turn-helix domain-containing protein [Flavobacteriia bacterium]
MKNPFEAIDSRLNSIESLLIAIAEAPKRTHSEPKRTRVLNVKEAAEFLGLKVPTIYSKVNRRELPFMKRSKRLYFSEDDLLAYLNEGRVASFEEFEGEANQYLNNKKGLK